jgi:hypothetical protein
MVSLASMFSAGTAALRRRPGVLLGLYAVHMVFAVAFLFTVARVLRGHFGLYPGFSRGVAGDLGALFDALRASPVVAPLLSFGLVLAVLYFGLSLFLHGGVLERLRSREDRGWAEGMRAFAAGGAAHVGRMARLWLWSLLLWIPVLIALAVGAVAAGPGLHTMTPGELAGQLVLALAPGLVLAALASLIIDLARVALVADQNLSAFRALRAGLRRAGSGRALLHFAAYLAAWLLVSGLYVALTAGKPYAGTGG